MGIRKKIALGFVCIGMLMLLSVLISLFQFSSLSRQTRTILSAGTLNVDLSRAMSDALQEQNAAILQRVVSGKPYYSEHYEQARARFDAAMNEATATVRDLTQVEALLAARDRFVYAVDGRLFSPHVEENSRWYGGPYNAVYGDLLKAIGQYASSNETLFRQRAAALERRAHNSATPALLMMAVMVTIIGMFFFLLDLYYIKPVVAMRRALEGYLRYKIAFDVKMDGRDEVYQLKESIGDLIATGKSKKET
ncbi:hypothetical protein FACS1894159_09980 [Bacteroidia bacterium]|nr:hypothetical protein FACS1894159_09980 [Bacteroidia bacterium]